MQLTIADEIHLLRAPDGTFWSNTDSGYAHYEPVLEIFSSVRVLCRSLDTRSIPCSAKRIDGPRVTVHPVTDYRGPWQYARCFHTVAAEIRKAYRRPSAYLLRAPSLVGLLLSRTLATERHPYAVRVVADPDGRFSAGVDRHFLRPFFRLKYCRDLRRLCRNAVGVNYVTSRALQHKFPPPAGAFVADVSDAELHASCFAAQPRVYRSPLRRARIVHVGAFTQQIKGQGYLLEAIRSLLDRGLDVRLRLVGDGESRELAESTARSIGIQDRVNFAGVVRSGDDVLRLLDEADIFVLPSLTEGLPRALLEAMSRALPCVGTDVGGIPELLPADCLVPARDSAALADRLVSLLSNPVRLTELSARNLCLARSYEWSRTNGARVDFYRQIRQFTERWLRSLAA